MAIIIGIILILAFPWLFVGLLYAAVGLVRILVPVALVLVFIVAVGAVI